MSVGRSQVDSPKVACWAERRRPSLRPLHALRVRGEHATLERDPAAGPPANPSHLERALTDRAALAVDLAGVRVFDDTARIDLVGRARPIGVRFERAQEDDVAAGFGPHKLHVLEQIEPDVSAPRIVVTPLVQRDLGDRPALRRT